MEASRQSSEVRKNPTDLSQHRTRVASTTARSAAFTASELPNRALHRPRGRDGALVEGADPGSRRSSKRSRERDEMKLRVCRPIPDPQVASWHLPSVRQHLHLLAAARPKNREDVAECGERTCALQGANDTRDVAPRLRPRRAQTARVAQKALRVAELSSQCLTRSGSSPVSR